MRRWVFTSKPESFRMEEALEPGATLDWPSFSHFKFAEGDLVYFYASNPVCQLIGKCKIERADLPWSEVDPRNDLRKWPRRYSSIPWLRLRVLQRAPIPFKPLGRDALYYHTGFKPSPYPKLLHDSEKDYVNRAFDNASDYIMEAERYEDGVDPQALKHVALMGLNDIPAIEGYVVDEVISHLAADSLEAVVAKDDNRYVFKFEGIVRVNWLYHRRDHQLSRLRLTMENTYLLANFDGADLEVLAERLTISQTTL